MYHKNAKATYLMTCQACGHQYEVSRVGCVMLGSKCCPECGSQDIKSHEKTKTEELFASLLSRINSVFSK